MRAFENRVLRIFGSKKDEVTEEWRKLHNEDLNDLYYSTSFMWVIRWRRMRWVGHVACMGGGLCRVLVRKPEGRNHLEDPRLNGSVVLSCIFGSGASQGLCCAPMT